MSRPHWKLERLGIEAVREGDTIALPRGDFERGHNSFPVEQVIDCPAIEKVVLVSGANRFHFEYGQDVVVIRPVTSAQARAKNGKAGKQ